MRKFFSVTVIVLLVASMLSSAALAQGAKEPKGSMGAGRGQKQSQNDSVPGVGASNKPDRDSYGNNHQKDQKSPAENPPADDAGLTGDEDGCNAEETPGGPKKDKESKHDEKPQAGVSNGNAYGRVRNTQNVLDAIGQLAGEETAAQLNTLFSAYRDAKDDEIARAALTALLDALTQACANEASGEGTETPEPFTNMNMESLREKVLANAGHDNGTLLALMHAYENALLSMNHQETTDDAVDDDETDGPTNDGAGADENPNS